MAQQTDTQPTAEDRAEADHWIAHARAAEPGGDDYQEAVMALHRRGDRATFEAARALLDADEPPARALAADVLGQLGVPERTLPEACFAALTDRLRREEHPAVLAALAHNLGGLEQPGAVGAVLPLADHPDPDVRYGAVRGLMGHDDPRAIDALIALSADPEPDVRSWATFALGSQTEVDTPALRAALMARLDDDALDAEIRGEALVGLAERGVDAIVDHVARALSAGLDPLAVEAAGLLGAPALLPALKALRAHPEMTVHFRSVTLDDAIARCDPEADV